MKHALKCYEDARKLCHVEKDVKGINTKKLVIIDHPRLAGNASQVGIQQSNDTWLDPNTIAIYILLGLMGYNYWEWFVTL